MYRPGLKACEELGIISPLANNNLAKQEIRDYSKQLGIATYNKPSNACLASRFDYNIELTLEKLKLVETGEKYLHDLGMLHVRLRVHGDVARLEVEPQDFMKIIENKELIQNIKNLGFRFVPWFYQHHRLLHYFLFFFFDYNQSLHNLRVVQSVFELVQLLVHYF